MSLCTQERSDKTPELWKEHARQFWTQPYLANEHGEAYNFVRRSEKSSDEMRDPKDRLSTDTYRIHWLEARVGDIYEEMVRVGKLHYEGFHLSWPAFLDLRPFYVKNATRETCMCIYHLRFAEFSKGLISYRKTLREQKISKCKCSWPINERFLQQQLICPRKEGAVLDNEDCIAQRCPDCKGARKLTSGGPGSLCADEMRDLPAVAAAPTATAPTAAAAAPVAAPITATHLAACTTAACTTAAVLLNGTHAQVDGSERRCVKEASAPPTRDPSAFVAANAAPVAAPVAASAPDAAAPDAAALNAAPASSSSPLPPFSSPSSPPLPPPAASVAALPDTTTAMDTSPDDCDFSGDYNFAHLFEPFDFSTRVTAPVATPVAVAAIAGAAAAISAPAAPGPTDRPTDRPTDPPTNQPTDRPTIS